jgi:hypothetical protein
MIMSESLQSNPTLEDGYRAMADDEDRETEALEWAEATIGDVAEEPGYGLVDSSKLTG